jgi:glycosyltransferase involved in cell wall biosynthesis
MKKILYYLPSQGVGGSNFLHALEVKKYKECGHKVIVVGKKGDLVGSELFQEIADEVLFSNRFLLALNLAGFDKFNSRLENIKKYFTDIIKIFYSAYIFTTHLLKFKPNFVVVGDFPLMQFIIFSKFFKVKVITYVLTSKTESYFKSIISEKIIQRADFVIANNKPLLNEWKLHDQQKIQIPTIVQNQFVNENDKAFENYLRAINLLNRKYILYIGAFSEIKGTYDFIKYAKRVIDEIDDIAIVMVGSYNQSFNSKYSIGDSNALYDTTSAVFKFIHDYKINENRLIILGRSPFAMNLLSNSEFLVSMNRYPHQPGPVFEAFSLSKPVLASDDKFSKEIVINGFNGYRLDIEDINEWIEKTKVLLSRNNCKDMGINAKEWYSKNSNSMDLAFYKLG